MKSLLLITALVFSSSAFAGNNLHCNATSESGNWVLNINLREDVATVKHIMTQTGEISTIKYNVDNIYGTELVLSAEGREITLLQSADNVKEYIAHYISENSFEEFDVICK